MNPDAFVLWPELICGFSVATLAFLTGLFGTGLIRQLAIRHGLIDVPNRRSSHSAPVPRGGGAAVVGAVILAGVLLQAAGLLNANEAIALLAGGAPVALIGFLDDRREVSPAIRLAVHAGAAVWAVWWVGGVAPQPIGEAIVDFRWLGTLFSVIAVIWMLNLFNFMDGIDGIAAAEAVFICGAGALLIAVDGGPAGYVFLLLALTLGNLGFLVWNWAPARIFMGDVGSGFMGFAIAVMALMSAKESSVSVWTWIILSSLFFSDATTTLARRMWRKERWYAAHRTHAYQWLSRRWGSHAKVVATYMLFNILLILPVAYLSVLFPEMAMVLALGLLVVTCWAVFVCGAGRPEH